MIVYVKHVIFRLLKGYRRCVEKQNTKKCVALIKIVQFFAVGNRALFRESLYAFSSGENLTAVTQLLDNSCLQKLY